MFVLLEFSGKVINHLPNDLAKFTAFDPDLNQAKADLLESTYLGVLTYGTDNTEVGGLKELTEQVSAEMKNCISVFKDVRYFARKKFAYSPAILQQFGLNKYRQARQSQPAMVLFMNQLEKTTKKYATELLAAGLKQTQIDAIEPAREALEATNSD